MLNKKMPVMFVGHGSPMNAIEDNQFSRAWREIGREIAIPRAIVAISAHWQSEGLKTTGDSEPKQIYDFYGFPDELYAKKYPVKGSEELAKELVNIGGGELNFDWGIDHGTWSVLCQMFPEADIPVVQLSLDINRTVEEHWQLAKKLSGLREKGILILGSGNMVHNLGMVKWQEDGEDWAIKFDSELKKLIETEDYEQLKKYQTLANWQMAIPTPEHYWPLLYILALREKDERIEFRTEKVTMGSISMRSVIIGEKK